MSNPIFLSIFFSFRELGFHNFVCTRHTSKTVSLDRQLNLIYENNFSDVNFFMVFRGLLQNIMYYHEYYGGRRSFSKPQQLIKNSNFKDNNPHRSVATHCFLTGLYLITKIPIIVPAVFGNWFSSLAANPWSKLIICGIRSLWQWSLKPLPRTVLICFHYNLNWLTLLVFMHEIVPGDACIKNRPL